MPIGWPASLSHACFTTARLRARPRKPPALERPVAPGWCQPCVRAPSGSCQGRCQAPRGLAHVLRCMCEGPAGARELGVQWRSLGAHRRRRLHLRFPNLEAAVCRRLLFFEICLGSCDEKFHASDVGNQRTGVCPHHQHIVTIKTIATSALYISTRPQKDPKNTQNSTPCKKPHPPAPTAALAAA